MATQQRLRIEVLSPARELIAAFVSPVEAWRYAALLVEPGCQPVVRRTWDGAELALDASATLPALARWVQEGDMARGEARLVAAE